MKLWQLSLKAMKVLFGSNSSQGRGVCAADPALQFIGYQGLHTVRIPNKVRAWLSTLQHYTQMLSAASANRPSNPQGELEQAFKHAPYGTKCTTDTQETTW